MAKRPTAPTLEDQFTAIAEAAIRAAEHVPCSQEDFRDGLETIVDALRERLDLVRDELRPKDPDA